MKTIDRRDFVQRALLASAGLTLVPSLAWAEDEPEPAEQPWAPPAQNDLKLKEPLPFPEADASVERAKLLVKAIREDNPEIALPFFFPQDVFRRVKAIKDPDRYFKRLIRVYNEDIKLMRKGLKKPDEVEFVSFGLGRQKRWVKRGKEGNAYPYWACYKCPLTVKDNGREKILPMRVMINWGDQWYVTHLTNK